MKYTVEVLIDQPLQLVSDSIRSREAAFKWMEGLLKFDLIDGVVEEVNSKHIMEFKQGKKTTKMTETTLLFDPPYRFDMLYEAGGVWNKTINHFSDMGDGTTKYTMENEFKFGFPLKLFLPLFPKMFHKETLKGMNAFKNYVESLKEE